MKRHWHHTGSIIFSIIGEYQDWITNVQALFFKGNPGSYEPGKWVF